jgi:hypothetical protein
MTDREHNDLFLSMEEAHEERAAIMDDSGIQDPEALRADLHRHEVASVIRRYYPRGEEAAEYFKLVEKKRGKEAADKLRADCRIAWKKRANTEATGG